jgi:phosphopantothenoylcysteine decarboxylase/phosphopantothenate--cysteine ligase
VFVFEHYYGQKVHLGVTGSIAAYKSLNLLRLLLKSNLQVGVTLTRAGEKFIPALNFKALGAEPVFTEQDHFRQDFPHLYPQHSNAFLICPCTANTLNKIAQGLADNLLTTQVLAFSQRVLLAPAMNPQMWSNPLTQANLTKLKKHNFILIEPEEGEVACKDRGKGRLAREETIYYHLLKSLTPQDLKGKKVLVTAGPTREYFDLVRFWSNPSSGKTGLAIALAAWLRGAEVYLVHGPINIDLDLLPEFTLLPITTAKQMAEKVLDLWPQMDMGIFSAAVCDFRPPYLGETKLKKEQQKKLVLEFETNPDILATVGQKKTSTQKLAGFALESQDVLEKAKSKLINKNLDLILANKVGKHSPFGEDKNEIILLDKKGREEHWPLLPKTEIAWRLWDILLST